MGLLEILLNLAKANPGFTLFSAITIIEIAPIKINPWRMIAIICRNALMGDILKQNEEMSEKLEKLEKQREEDNINMARRRILRFADEIMSNVPHSRELFNDIMMDVDTYEKYCKEHPDYVNNRATMAIAVLKRSFTSSVTTRSFLNIESEV